MAVLDHVEDVPNGINGVAQRGPPEPAAHAGNKQHLKSVAANLREVPAYSPRRLRVVTIGAGYSGLTLAHKFQHQHPELASIVDHTIYEAFPFDPNPDWSRFFSTGPEIWAYMKKIAQKWNLERDVKYDHRVVGAYWQEDRGQWKVNVEHEGMVIEDFADVLVSAQGFLNSWNWPSIPGLQDFQGKKVHSASWDHTYDYSNKRIAVIGNGSSGIQILPQMAKLEGTRVTSFQRGPTWVVSTMSPASLLGKDDTSYNPEYTEDEKKRFRDEPGLHHKYRKTIIDSINDSFKMFIKNSPLNQEVLSLARTQMAEKLKHDADLCEKLIPKWELGCRRITPGEGYLESFLRPTVTLTQSPISEIRSNGVQTADQKFYEVDVGPNALIGHGSLMESLGWSAEYMIKWIKKIAFEDIKAVVPKESAVEDFIVYSDQIHQTLTWTGACRSWYKNNTVDGRVTATFAGSALLFKKLIEELRPEDFDIEPRDKNRFRFLGNGFTAYELQKGNDLAWYVEK
ncbi:hypothetical protein LTS06_003185 [Exophiala xenobiotica]|nr:hypothetical protein LTS06_003185 [Exophiala xenobiotica]